MRIGLYGLPCSGKTTVLKSLNSLTVYYGSSMLEKIAPDFHSLNESNKETVRIKLAESMMKYDNFIMDGHHSFGDNTVFTLSDGQLYDTIIYLYVSPAILEYRMKKSSKNEKYLCFDIESWQEKEIEELRSYCHGHGKDFYVVDDPEVGYFSNMKMLNEFIEAITKGFSCYRYAVECADKILDFTQENKILLFDGDKTITMEDTSGMLGYRTHLFDGNFYTGFQSWRHSKVFSDFLSRIPDVEGQIRKLNIQFNYHILSHCEESGEKTILTSGYHEIWQDLAEKLGMHVFYGEQMSAETKYFITKRLQEAGKTVFAFGDGMNDYYMMIQADKGYLATKKDGSVSRSLKGKKLEGLIYV